MDVSEDIFSFFNSRGSLVPHPILGGGGKKSELGELVPL